MQVCTLLHTDNHASTPPLCFLQAGCPSCRPTNSVKAPKAPYVYSANIGTAVKSVMLTEAGVLSGHVLGREELLRDGRLADARSTKHQHPVQILLDDVVGGADSNFIRVVIHARSAPRTLQPCIQQSAAVAQM